MDIPDPTNATPVTPPATGNTQTQATLFGSGYTKNGQPVTKPIASDTDGSMKVSMSTAGFSGGYSPQAGDVLVFSMGLFIYGFRKNGTAISPLPTPVPPVGG